MYKDTIVPFSLPSDVMTVMNFVKIKKYLQNININTNGYMGLK
jgi:hypothetical protein